MTLSIPLGTLPDAGTGQDVSASPPALVLSLALSRPADPALVSLPGHGSPPTQSGWPKDRSGRWLRNAAVGLGVLAAAAATVSFTAFGGLRYRNCLNAFEGRVGWGLAVSLLAGCGG